MSERVDRVVGSQQVAEVAESDGENRLAGVPPDAARCSPPSIVAPAPSLRRRPPRRRGCRVQAPGRGLTLRAACSRATSRSKLTARAWSPWRVSTPAREHERATLKLLVAGATVRVRGFLVQPSRLAVSATSHRVPAEHDAASSPLHAGRRVPGRERVPRTQGCRRPRDRSAGLRAWRRRDGARSRGRRTRCPAPCATQLLGLHQVTGHGGSLGRAPRPPSRNRRIRLCSSGAADGRDGAPTAGTTWGESETVWSADELSEASRRRTRPAPRWRVGPSGFQQRDQA